MFAVDLSSHSTKLPFKFLVFFYILAAGDGDLDKNNLVLQLGMIVEECVEALELLGQAFDMV